MRILIIDDCADGRDIAEGMLLADGYTQVSTAVSAADAYRFLTIGTPGKPEDCSIDLVLLDICMPDIDGIEACARIRNEVRYADVPIIMVTLLGDMDSLANAFVAGATDYIIKPINRVELLARVRSALKLKSELDRRLARERELLEFMSTWGDCRASHWIDATTGLFVSEVAAAYLFVAVNFASTSVIALAIDRLDAYRLTQGKAAADGIRTKVARAVAATAATVGVVAAAFRDGLIVLIVPELGSEPALELGNALRAAVSRLDITNSEAIAANQVTASVVVVTGRPVRWLDRFDLLNRAISVVARVSEAGGNRVVLEQV